MDGAAAVGDDPDVGPGVDPGVGDERFLDGVRRGAVWGTMWHGALENDGFRRRWLTEVAQAAGVPWTPTPGAPGFGERREAMIDSLADAVQDHLDLDLLLAGTRVGR